MLARCLSASLLGFDAIPVTVEVDLAPGLPGLQLVGLPDTAIQESRERVRAALRNSGFRGPLVRVVVNLAPADLRKEGPAFDLPIALALLVASGQLDARVLKDLWCAGNWVWMEASGPAAESWQLPPRPLNNRLVRLPYQQMMQPRPCWSKAWLFTAPPHCESSWNGFATEPKERGKAADSWRRHPFKQWHQRPNHPTRFTACPGKNSPDRVSPSLQPVATICFW